MTVNSAYTYIKASNTADGDNFGQSIALSADGNTLVVSAPLEDSGSQGVGADPADNSVTGSGAVYVFVRSAGSWSQQVYIKSPDPDSYDRFGFAVALSADGNRLVIGATGDDGPADTSIDSGAAFVYDRAGTTWTYRRTLYADNAEPGDELGASVAISGDGLRIAVAALKEDGANNMTLDSGAVYLFEATTGTQLAYLKPMIIDPNDLFGYAVAMSHDGSRIAISAVYEDSITTPAANDEPEAGAVYIFDGSVPTQTASATTSARCCRFLPMAHDWPSARAARTAPGSTSPTMRRRTRVPPTRSG